jgi:hypothetical protein
MEVTERRCPLKIDLAAYSPIRSAPWEESFTSEKLDHLPSDAGRSCKESVVFKLRVYNISACAFGFAFHLKER